MIKSFSKFQETFTPKKVKERSSSDKAKEVEQKTFDGMVKMFKQINDDELKKPEEESAYVPLTDWEYYSEQIENIYGYTTEKSIELAKRMAALESPTLESNDDIPMLDEEDQHTLETKLNEAGIEIGSINLRKVHFTDNTNSGNSIDVYLPNQNLDIIVTVNKKYDLHYKLRHHNRAVILQTTDLTEVIKRIKQHSVAS